MSNFVSQETNVLDSPSPLHSDDCTGLELAYAGEEVEGEDGKKRRNRGASTAERRATHNAVERARRETLNTRFQDLANALPNMANVKRPSKSAIVNKAIEYAQTSQDRERSLAAQNDALRAEVNELRARLGIQPLTPPVAPIQLPQRPREQSISSIHTLESTSPLLAGSPSSTYDAQQSFIANSALLGNTMGYSPASSNGDRRVSVEEIRVPTPPVQLVAPEIKAAAVQTSSAFAMSALGAAELGYWMGMQQPQPNPLVSAFMNMQTGHMAGMPSWQNPFPQLPVSAAAGGDAMNWLFA